MWFKFIVIGVKAGEKGKTAQAFLKYKGNESPFHVPDQQLAAFCLPLGPESQSQKERMSHEVSQGCLPMMPLAAVGFAVCFSPLPSMHASTLGLVAKQLTLLFVCQAILCLSVTPLQLVVCNWQNCCAIDYEGITSSFESCKAHGCDSYTLS